MRQVQTEFHSDISNEVSVSKGELLLTLAHLGLHVDLSLCDLSGLGMGGPQPLDVSDDLAPHIPFLMGVCGFFFGQPISRAIASCHVLEYGIWNILKYGQSKGLRIQLKDQPTRTDHILARTRVYCTRPLRLSLNPRGFRN